MLLKTNFLVTRGLSFINETLSVEKYRVFFDNLPEQIKIEVTRKYLVYIGDPQEEIIEQYNSMFGKLSKPTKQLIL